MKQLGKAIAALAVGALALTACGGGSNDPLAKPSSDNDKKSTGASGEALVVGGAGFTESNVLMEIYAGALNSKGVKASTKGNIGEREAYLSGLKDGSVDIFPEYTGNLVVYYDPKATATSPEEWYTKLKSVLPKELVALDYSPAVDDDSVTVTSETAKKYNLKTISDLQPVAKDLVLGGPPAWLTRERTGVPALKKTYGLTFKGEFKRFESQTLLVNALVNGQVGAGNVFTTNPGIFTNGFVVLEDDKHMFPSNNIVPLASKEAGTGEAAQILNDLAPKIDTKTLSDLDKQVDVDHKDIKAVADEWLKANGYS